jgi:xylulose-5-phosphate/fructose-6-phosphate phosphoketolase
MADSPLGVPSYQPFKDARARICGYKEKGNINTPMELAINNEIDRFSLAIDVIDRTPKLQRTGAPARKSTATSSAIAATTY